MLNVELKVRGADFGPVRARLSALGAALHGVLRQRDTYFRVSGARLKLREIEDAGAELIAYQRPDDTGGRISDYRIAPVEASVALIATLEHALGIRIMVLKERELWLYGHTRIHLDRVDGLGDFVEVETVLRDHSPEAARAEFDEVAGALALWDLEAVGGSYSELALDQLGSRTRNDDPTA